MRDMSELSKPSYSPLGLLVGVTLGAIVTVGDWVDEGITTAWHHNQQLWDAAGQMTMPIRESLAEFPVAKFAQEPVQAVVERTETTLAELYARGRSGLILGDGAVATTVTSIIGTVLNYLRDDPDVHTLIQAQVDWLLPLLAEHPAVKTLVREQVAAVLPALASDPAVQALVCIQAGQYIQYLQDNPDAVQGLIRTHGDIYIDYLNAHPTPVQSLIQGQSLSLAGQVRDEVRGRTATADGLVDVVVRNLLRLKPPEDLPLPPEAVQRRAETAHLSSDYTQTRGNGNA